MLSLCFFLLIRFLVGCAHPKYVVIHSPHSQRFFFCCFFLNSVPFQKVQNVDFHKLKLMNKKLLVKSIRQNMCGGQEQVFRIMFECVVFFFSLNFLARKIMKCRRVMQHLLMAIHICMCRNHRENWRQQKNSQQNKTKTKTKNEKQNSYCRKQSRLSTWVHNIRLPNKVIWTIELTWIGASVITCRFRWYRISQHYGAMRHQSRIQQLQTTNWQFQ